MYYYCILLGGISISVSVSVPVSVAARVIAIEISLNILGVQKFLERQVSELPPAQPTNQPTFSMFLSVFQRFLAFRNSFLRFCSAFRWFSLPWLVFCFSGISILSATQKKEMQSSRGSKKKKSCRIWIWNVCRPAIIAIRGLWDSHRCRLPMFSADKGTQAGRHWTECPLALCGVK